MCVFVCVCVIVLALTFGVSLDPSSDVAHHSLPHHAHAAHLHLHRLREWEGGGGVTNNNTRLFVWVGVQMCLQRPTLHPDPVLFFKFNLLLLWTLYKQTYCMYTHTHARTHAHSPPHT